MASREKCLEESFSNTQNGAIRFRNHDALNHSTTLLAPLPFCHVIQCISINTSSANDGDKRNKWNYVDMVIESEQFKKIDIQQKYELELIVENCICKHILYEVYVFK